MAPALVVWLVALSVCDIREQRLPNVLTLPGAAAIVAAACVGGRGWPAVLGAVGLALVYLVVHLIAPAGLGAGDVKLAVGLGALTGWFGVDVWLLAALTAPLLTAVWGVAALGVRRTTVPHGPSMCVASAVAVGLAVLG